LGYRGALLTTDHFRELASRGSLSSFLTSEEIRGLGEPRDAFLARVPLRDIGDSNWSTRLSRAETMVSKMIVCGRNVYVEGGEPIWYAFRTSRMPGNYAMSIGPEAWKVCGSLLPGPDREARRDSIRRGWALGLDEFQVETRALIAQGVKIDAVESGNDKR
jgi:hypothetical protein